MNLLPEKPLARIFRAKFRDLLKKAILFDQVPREIWPQDWVVDIISVASGEASLKYLAPYIFRVAISNNNILDLKAGQVTFRYRDSKTNTLRTATLPAERFIGRLLQHVLPRGFHKVRPTACCTPSSGASWPLSKNSFSPTAPRPSSLPTIPAQRCIYPVDRPPFSALSAPAR